jgi:hypothetical protein
MRVTKCMDCGERFAAPNKNRRCPECRELCKLICRLHKMSPSCPADAEAKARKVDEYARIVAAGGSIFEAA